MTKTPKQTLSIQTKTVLPNDTNPLDTLFGGSLLAWMDEIAAISAYRHSGRIVVTASISNVSFDKPILLGDCVTLEAKVSRAFKSSMEVFVDVYVEESNGKRVKSNEAIYTFVAIDQKRNPIEVPQLQPETPLEIERYNSALRRRQLSLVLARRMEPKDATELMAIFNND